SCAASAWVESASSSKGGAKRPGTNASSQIRRMAPHKMGVWALAAGELAGPGLTSISDATSISRIPPSQIPILWTGSKITDEGSLSAGDMNSYICDQPLISPKPAELSYGSSIP